MIHPESESLNVAVAGGILMHTLGHAKLLSADFQRQSTK